MKILAKRVSRNNNSKGYTLKPALTVNDKDHNGIYQTIRNLQL